MHTTQGVRALVTGANRGIGHAICRALAQRGASVLLGARDAAAGEAAAAALRLEGLYVRFTQIDVTHELEIEACRHDLEAKGGRLDILVNNAAIAIPSDTSLLDVPVALLDAALRTNCYGPMIVTRALVPALLRSSRPRVINVSSGVGATAARGAGIAAYRLSKACLNEVTRMLARELAETPVRVNAMCPGRARTRLGGSDALRSAEEAADSAVWLALDAPEELHGKFVRDREVIAW